MQPVSNLVYRLPFVLSVNIVNAGIEVECSNSYIKICSRSVNIKFFKAN